MNANPHTTLPPHPRQGLTFLLLVTSTACGSSHGQAELGPDAGIYDASPGSDARHCVGDNEARDGDRDGWFGCDDCDDKNPRVNPEVNEGGCCSTNLSDGLDNDCDGRVDERPRLFGCSCIEGDDDGDGYLDEYDCAPDESDIHPGNRESLGCGIDAEDGLDNDCDGEVDEGDLCDLDYDRWSAEDDCDDSLWNVRPDFGENCCPCAPSPLAWDNRARDCDDIDNDCDGEVDEEVSCDCGAADRDNDGFRAGDDCDDANGAVNPRVIECCCPEPYAWGCDGVDSDCDGEVDEAGPPLCCDAYTGFE